MVRFGRISRPWLEPDEVDVRQVMSPVILRQFLVLHVITYKNKICLVAGWIIKNRVVHIV